jgi:hypothetical protein
MEEIELYTLEAMEPLLDAVIERFWSKEIGL